jgi:hypothetical protein
VGATGDGRVPVGARLLNFSYGDLPMPMRFEPDTWYTEIELRLAGFATAATLKRARDDGLRCKEIVRGKRVYLGAWLNSWLKGSDGHGQAH